MTWQPLDPHVEAHLASLENERLELIDRPGVMSDQTRRRIERIDQILNEGYEAIERDLKRVVAPAPRAIKPEVPRQAAKPVRPRRPEVPDRRPADPPQPLADLPHRVRTNDALRRHTELLEDTTLAHADQHIHEHWDSIVRHSEDPDHQIICQQWSQGRRHFRLRVYLHGIACMYEVRGKQRSSGSVGQAKADEADDGRQMVHWYANWAFWTVLFMLGTDWGNPFAVFGGFLIAFFFASLVGFLSALFITEPLWRRLVGRAAPKTPWN